VTLKIKKSKHTPCGQQKVNSLLTIKTLYRQHLKARRNFGAKGLLKIVRVCNGNLAMEEEKLHGRSMTSVIYNSDLKPGNSELSGLENSVYLYQRHLRPLRCHSYNKERICHLSFSALLLHGSRNIQRATCSRRKWRGGGVQGTGVSASQAGDREREGEKRVYEERRDNMASRASPGVKLPHDLAYMHVC
jgi:hypothetical protein